MTNVTPISPALLAAIQVALDNFQPPQGQLVALAAKLIEAPQQLHNLKTQQVLNAVVAQVAQVTGGGEVVTVKTQRGDVTLTLAALQEKIDLPVGTALRLVINPQVQTNAGQLVPPNVFIQVQETLIKKPPAPLVNTIPAPVLGQKSAPNNGTVPQNMNVPLLNLLQVEPEQPVVSKPLIGSTLRATVLTGASALPSQAEQAPPVQSAGAQNTGGILKNLLGKLTSAGTTALQPAVQQAQTSPTKTLSLHVTTVFQPGETPSLPKPPLGQVGLVLQPQTKMTDGQMTALVVGQTKPLVTNSGEPASLVGQRVTLPVQNFPPLQTGQSIAVTLPELLDDGFYSLPVSSVFGGSLLDKPDATQATPPKLTAQNIFFLTAMQMANDPETLPQLAASLSLRAAGGLREEISARTKQLLTDMVTRTKDDGGELSSILTAGWKATPLPANVQTGVLAAWMHIHIPENPYERQTGADEKPKKEKKADRFVFDLSLSRMGRMQIDGLVREKMMNVVVRSEQAMSIPMQHTMTSRFVDVLEANGLAGGLRFVVSAPNQPDWTPWNTASSNKPVDHADLTA